MSKFDDGKRDTSPTRLVRNKPTKKVSSTDGTTIKIGEEKPASGDAPTININQDSVDFRSEEGAIAGGNLNESTDQQQAVSADTGGKTVLVRRSADTTEKPTVGWLVVVSGPGQGRAVYFSYGLNKIGRDAGQEISLAFGDDEISRLEHASIEFDPKERKFYLSKGENLVYLNGDRVGSGGEKVLQMGDELTLGSTTLRFVPFCGEDFDWPAPS